MGSWDNGSSGWGGREWLKDGRLGGGLMENSNGIGIVTSLCVMLVLSLTL